MQDRSLGLLVQNLGKKVLLEVLFFFFSTKIAVLTVFSLNFNVKLNALRQLNEKQGQCRSSQAAEVSV